MSQRYIELYYGYIILEITIIKLLILVASW